MTLTHAGAETNSVKHWWQTGVIYQIYPMSFADANGDGIGDLRGIIDRLDHLNDGTPGSLGVDAIWLSPVYPSPRRDFGYDVSDYCDIDPTFGTLDEFDELVSEGHRRGIRVIMDLVLNHTSDQHPWFLESRSSRDSLKRDWYIWADGREPGKPPNNWRSAFGGSAWTWDQATEQWYMHGFLPEQPDVNWRNPQVKAAMFDVVRFWLDRGVDGFRLDVVNHYFKDDLLSDNPPGDMFALNPYRRQRHIYDKDRAELHRTLEELRALLDGYADRMSVGEVFSDRLAEVAASLYGRENRALHLAFNLEFADCPWDPAAFQEEIKRWEGALPEGGWPCYTLSNHDRVRHYTRYAAGKESAQRAKVAAGMLLTLRGTPFLYYGEEIGMRQTSIPRREIQDPPGRRYWPIYKGRDGCRTPMQWNGRANAGFTTGQPWLRVNRDHVDRNVETQALDPRSLLGHYRQLIWLRKATPALLHGSLALLQDHPKEALSFLRETPEQTIWVILNFCNRPIRLVPDKPLPARRWRVLYSTAGRSGTEQPGQSGVFAPYEVCIMEAL